MGHHRGREMGGQGELDPRAGERKTRDVLHALGNVSEVA